MLELIIEDLGITKRRVAIGAVVAAGAGVLIALGGSPVLYALAGAASTYVFMRATKNA